MSRRASRMPTLAPLRLPRLGDDRLAALAAAGDERAFEALYDRHHRALLGFRRHMLGTREEAEDALQQTFLRAHRALAARGAPTELPPWLYTIARNCCLTMLSARRPVADGEREHASTEAPGRAGPGARRPASRGRRRRAAARRAAGGARAGRAGRPLPRRDRRGDRRAGRQGEGVDPPGADDADRRARGARDAVRVDPRTARHRQGGALRRGPLRRHLRVCAGCRGYREAVGEQRSALALVLR